jgi:ribosomal protein S18 acetylase RimI-like enzyme
MAIDIVRIDAGSTGLLATVDEVFDEPIDRDRVEALVAESNHILLVAVSGGVVVGQCLGVIHRHPDKATELYLDDLAVADSLKRRGIATRLINEAIRLGKERGCEEIWVGAEPDNEEANSLYEALGLKMVPMGMWEGEL